MFDQIIRYCTRSGSSLFIKYAKFFPEVVDGVNIICTGLNFVFKKAQLPIVLEKFANFTDKDKEILRNSTALAVKIQDTSSKESVLLEKTVRTLLWLAILFIGYIGFGQWLLCNIVLIVGGLITTPKEKGVEVKDISYYWFLLTSSIFLESVSVIAVVFSFIPMYAFIKFVLFYAALNYAVVRQKIKQVMQKYLTNFKAELDVDEILSKAKKITSTYEKKRF